MSQATNPTVKQTIQTADEAMLYIDSLAASDLLYHFDDDAADCLSAHQLRRHQIEAIQHNVDQLMAVDWTGTSFFNPFHYMIANH